MSGLFENIKAVENIKSVENIKAVKNSLGKKLSKVRGDAGISRAQMVGFLKQKGFDVKTYTISKWETGVSKPAVDAFLAFCDICGVKDIGLAFNGKRPLRLYDIPVSAGSGNFLDGGGYEMIEVDGIVPDSADYAVKVSGDSMTPRFVDRQIIFVHEQPSLDEGEIGIFCLNNEAYLKKLEKGRLISLNPKYSPIPIRDFDDFRVFGKVVG
ncbi:MAG: XRE family transcriptional regulator [Oscillospiraceae bacterium]|nr:XRE family transcriptional regulator [Oscillospiraceae bacterium]